MTERHAQPDRDVAAFDRRAQGYETGWRGRLHAEITSRTAALAERTAGNPSRILDIGCGTGQLLRRLATSFPDAEELRGIDPAPSMTAMAAAAADDRRLRFDTGVAEQLPYPDARFGLVVSTASFDHWADQQAGLREAARVLAGKGQLLLVDLFSPLLAPTLINDRRDKARTRRRVDRLLEQAGFTSASWDKLYTPIINAVVAVAR